MNRLTNTNPATVQGREGRVARLRVRFRRLTTVPAHAEYAYLIDLTYRTWS